MWLLFLLVFLVLFMASIFNTNTQKGARNYILFIFTVFAVLIMFRASTVGNDTEDYLKLFKFIASDNIKSFINDSRYEAGYIYLNKLLSNISTDPQILLIVTGLFTAISFGRFIYKYSAIPWFSAYMFLTLQYYDLSLSGIRQILSISILLFSFDFLINRKLIWFVLTVILAVYFHSSAAMFMLIYIIVLLKKSNYFYPISGVIAVAVFVMFSRLFSIIGRVFPNYVKYLTTEGTSYTNSATLAVTLMLALWIILFGISFYINSMSKFKDDVDNLDKDRYFLLLNDKNMNNVHEIGVWLGVIMLFLALQGTILNRFKYIYSVSMLIYYPNALAKITNQRDRAILLMGSCIIFLLYIVIIYIFRPEWQSSYPYSFFWQK
jgi:hypothetical protein